MRFHPRRIAFAFASLALTVTLAACGSDGDSPEAAGTTVPASGEPAPSTTVATSPGVVLEDPGAEPRQVLLLRVAEGATASMAMESRIGMEMTADGQALPVGEVPGTRMVLDQSIDRVDTDGTFHYSMTFRELAVVPVAGSDPQASAAAAEALSQLEGLTGSGTSDAHGGSQAITFDTSGITDSALRSTIGSVSSQVGNVAPPFPREPVGVGARWTTTSSAEINGIRMNTTVHYTLVSRTGDRYELEYTQEAEAPPGPASFPGMPTGSRATIVSFTMQSTGTTTGDLTRHLPTSSTASGTGDARFTVSVGAERSTLEQHLTVDFDVSEA